MGRGMRASTQPGSGSKVVPHVITAILSIALSLGIAHWAHTGNPGPQGPPGTTTITNKLPNAGVCVEYGHAGHVVLVSPTAPVKGAEIGYCAKGTFVSVVPG